MQTDADGDGNSYRSPLFPFGYSDSVYRENQNLVMPGIPFPFTMAESLNNNITRGQIPSRAAIANPGSFWDTNEPGKNIITSGFSNITSSYPQITSIQDMTSVARYATPENQEKLYPFDCPTTFVNSSNNYEGLLLPFDTSTRWEGGKFTTPPQELVGRAIGRTGVQPITGDSAHNEWIMTEEGGLNSYNQSSSRFSHELSLSLATSQPSIIHGTSIQEQCSDMGSSGVNSYSMRKRHVASEHASCSSNNNYNNSLSLSFNSYKPIQISSFLSGSSFFHAMQEVLAEIACYAFDQVSYSNAATGIGKGGRVSLSSSCSFSDGLEEEADRRFTFQNNLVRERDFESKKKHLLSLLQLVDEQYNQCVDEIHTVVSAFHAVTELDPNLYARFALPTISIMYKNLRERISTCILAMGEHTSERISDHISEGEGREENLFETSFIQKQWALQQLRKRDHQLWRPQRGLPERSVSVLRAWMFQNFLHPYPKDAEKHLLAVKSGLTRSQVSNWFINARVRLWKPMIEEMYAEMNRRKTHRNDEENDVAHRNHMRFENRRLTMD